MGAQGVSLASCILAMATQIFAAAYSIAEEHPFSSYGEAFPQHLCTLTVALQCLRYNFYFSYAKLLQSAGTGLGLAYVLCRAKFFLGRRLGRQSASMLQSSVPALTRANFVTLLTKKLKIKTNKTYIQTNYSRLRN